MSVTADDSRLWYTYNWGKYFNNTAQLIGALLYWYVINTMLILELKKAKCSKWLNGTDQEKEPILKSNIICPMSQGRVAVWRSRVPGFNSS